jgi:hypothetical protein
MICSADSVVSETLTLAKSIAPTVAVGITGGSALDGRGVAGGIDLVLANTMTSIAV